MHPDPTRHHTRSDPPTGAPPIDLAGVVVLATELLTGHRPAISATPHHDRPTDPPTPRPHHPEPAAFAHTVLRSLSARTHLGALARAGRTPPPTSPAATRHPRESRRRLAAALAAIAVTAWFSAHLGARAALPPSTPTQ